MPVFLCAPNISDLFVQTVFLRLFNAPAFLFSAIFNCLSYQGAFCRFDNRIFPATLFTLPFSILYLITQHCPFPSARLWLPSFKKYFSIFFLFFHYFFKKFLFFTDFLIFFPKICFKKRLFFVKKPTKKLTFSFRLSLLLRIAGP